MSSEWILAIFNIALAVMIFLIAYIMNLPIQPAGAAALGYSAAEFVVAFNNNERR